jgi:hypothetical protein
MGDAIPGGLYVPPGIPIKTHYLPVDDAPKSNVFYTGVIATLFFTLALPFFRGKPAQLAWGSDDLQGFVHNVGHHHDPRKVPR